MRVLAGRHGSRGYIDGIQTLRRTYGTGNSARGAHAEGPKNAPVDTVRGRHKTCTLKATPGMPIALTAVDHVAASNARLLHAPDPSRTRPDKNHSGRNNRARDMQAHRHRTAHIHNTYTCHCLQADRREGGNRLLADLLQLEKRTPLGWGTFLPMRGEVSKDTED